jgi:SSS family solute:Na+ symporter
MTPTHLVELSVFIFFFLLVTVVGFLASRWRRGDLNLLDEWGLGGRSFGTLITWFLIGGDLYTAYTVIAVPALVFGAGAMGFFALVYTTITYPFGFLILPRLWAVSRRHGYVTVADYVRGRYGSHWLALAVALTGILATMPYIALQLIGMNVVLAQMGLKGDWPLLIAFLILALYTYSSGLRAPALIALVKDAMIYVMVLTVVIYIPYKLGGYGHIFAAAGPLLAAKHPPGALILPSAAGSAYSSLALGSALALFLYPHSVTAVLAAKSGDAIRRNQVLLPAYSLLLGLIALMGLMALVAGLHPATANLAIPMLIEWALPPWFAGFCFAAIAIGALVPAAIMSIAAANLFTRSFYREYLRKDATPRQESQVAKLVSLVVKLGALAFILFLPQQYAINLQLFGGAWILQTFPAIVFGLWKRRFHHLALLAGWAVGMITSTGMELSLHLKGSIYPLHFFGKLYPAYSACYALALNLAVAVLLTLVLDAAGIQRHPDLTTDADYEDNSHLPGGAQPAPVPAEF